MRPRYLLAFGALFWLATAARPQRVITTIAGTDWLFPGDGRPAINAPLSGGLGLDLAADRNGSYFIADDGNLMAMRVGPDGILSVIAGNGFGFVSGDGGLAVNAGLFQPIAVAVDGAGSVYISEFGGAIRKVTADGIITRVAGTGNRGFGGDNGPAVSALLDAPYGLAVDSAGNFYIADTGNNRIRKVNASGVITTIAGTGQPGFSGDSGYATNAQLSGPTRIALDAAGDLYFVDLVNFRVRKIDVNGIITTVAGGGQRLGDGIPATSAILSPLAIALDAAGTLYIADGLSYGIVKVDSQGNLKTIAGGSGTAGFDGDGGSALAAHFQFQFHPALAIDSAGSILFADEVNERIRRITPDGKVGTIAGNGLFHFSGEGGRATSASLDLPTSVIADNSGNIFFTEPDLNRIRRVAPDGTISVYAGNGTQGYSGDGGLATSASLAFPNYLALGPNGVLYFTDNFNCVIRYITGSGAIGTYAGSGACADAGDGGPASQASFSGLEGLDFDTAGDLIISEGFKNRLRVVLYPSGMVATLAGNGTAGFSGDNGVSTKALVNDPVGVRVYNGFVYFCDSKNHRVRKIAVSDLTITTVAGNGQAG
jgi:trimeric autotransporter adhesin